MKFIKIKGKDFEMQECPVTQKEYAQVMGRAPSYFEGKPTHPVEQVSWDDAQEFIKKLNEKKDDFTYRLPTEQEWEYCCRAGSTTEYCFGDNESRLKQYAWYYDNSKQSTHPVRKKKANKFGLYDMRGNVWEWTESKWSEEGSYRVVRGGSWNNDAQVLRSAYRSHDSPGSRSYVIGFRLVRTSGNTLPSNTLTLDGSKDPKALARAIAKAQEALDELKELLK